MIYENDKINIGFLEAQIRAKGIKKMQFYNFLWGEQSHYTLKYLEGRNVSIQTAIKICNFLDIHLDDLFIGHYKGGKSPLIYGNNNIQNSTVINHDIASLRAENSALKEVNSMLKKDKEDLGRRLDKVLDFIRKSDGTILKEDVQKK